MSNLIQNQKVTTAIFTNDTETLYESWEKSPKILKQINLAKTRQPFSAAEVKELGAVNDV